MYKNTTITLSSKYTFSKLNSFKLKKYFKKILTTLYKSAIIGYNQIKGGTKNVQFN